MLNNDQIVRLSQPPSTTEGIKCQRIRNRIETAITAVYGTRISIYYQGSYGNRTNISLESDVDVVVEYTAGYYPGLHLLSPEQIVEYHRTHTSHDYNHAQLRANVHQILINEFGESNIDSKRKCLRVIKDANRVNADVIPCFTYKKFVTPNQPDPIEGVQFFTADTLGEKIISYPKKHIKNGEDKNTATSGRYKDVVRILKNIRQDLIDNATMEESLIDSHLIESVVYNVPNPQFIRNVSHRDLLEPILRGIYSMTQDMRLAAMYKKVHEQEDLFGTSYYPSQVQTFVEHAWLHIGY